MAKKKVEKLKKRSSDWEPSQRDLDLILNRLKHTGQENITHIERDKYAEACRRYRELYPQDGVDSINYKYFTLLNYMKYIFIKYRIEFFAWISDPKWLFPLDRKIETFLKTGYLPDKYKSSEGQGGFFKWVPNAAIELIMIPRGTGKTTKWMCMRALWMVINHPTYKWLIVHADKDRAKGLIDQIKEMMLQPYLGLVFPELFTDDPQMFKNRSGNILTREKINIVTFNEETEEEFRDGSLNSEFRKEATFTVGSPQIDRTSWHFEGVFTDDISIDDTSKNPKVTQQIVSYFTSLFAMQQYRDDWSFKCYMTGTEWWEKSLYTVIKEEYSNATVFEMPATWEYMGDTEMLCRYFDEDMLAKQKDLQKKWYDSQMMMKPRPYEGGQLNIGFSIERNVMEVTLDELETLKNEHMIAQICDPSFSKKHKTEGDKKSRFSIIHSVVSEDLYMVYGAWQTFGMDTGGIKSVNIELGKKEDIDFFIQDAQGQGQTGLYDEQIRLMRDAIPYLASFKHTKSMGSKEEVANKVLSFLCETRELVVLKVKNDPDEERRKYINRLINELLGIGGMDFVDCVVYMVADIDRNSDVRAARLRKNLKHNKSKGFRNISLRTHSNYGRLS